MSILAFRTGDGDVICYRCLYHHLVASNFPNLFLTAGKSVLVEQDRKCPECHRYYGEDIQDAAAQIAQFLAIN